jgi:hypothetical protein
VRGSGRETRNRDRSDEEHRGRGSSKVLHRSSPRYRSPSHRATARCKRAPRIAVGYRMISPDAAPDVH